MKCKKCGSEFSGYKRYCSETCKESAQRLNVLKRRLSKRIGDNPLTAREFELELLICIFNDEPAHRALREYRRTLTPFEVMKANFRKMFCR